MWVAIARVGIGWLCLCSGIVARAFGNTEDQTGVVNQRVVLILGY
jgi:hypothetical protein